MLVAQLIDEKYIQFGFAGFCFLLIGVIIWLIRTHNKINSDNVITLVDVIQKNNKVLARVFDAINSMKESEDQVKYSVDGLSSDMQSVTKDLTEKVNKLQIELSCRPCMNKDK